jgi:CBS domain-containing protein
MKTVRDVMRADLDVVRSTASVAEAARYLATHEADAVVVCREDGSLAGEVTPGDIVAMVVARGLDPAATTMGELSDRAVAATAGDGLGVGADLSVEEAAGLMSRGRRACMPVVEGGRVIGTVTRRDVARSVTMRPPWDDT